MGRHAGSRRVPIRTQPPGVPRTGIIILAYVDQADTAHVIPRGQTGPRVPEKREDVLHAAVAASVNLRIIAVELKRNVVRRYDADVGALPEAHRVGKRVQRPPVEPANVDERSPVDIRLPCRTNELAVGGKGRLTVRRTRVTMLGRRGLAHHA